MLPNTHTNPLFPEKSISGGYKEENRSANIDNTPKMENNEFQNKRVPLDGIELLLNQEKVPDSLGKRMDKKNIKETHLKETHNPSSNTAMLSDLDDIISDADSLQDNNFKQPSPNRHKDRMKRRFIKRKKHKLQDSGDFFPKTKFSNTFSSKPQTPLSLSDNVNEQDVPNDDISDIVSDGNHHQRDIEEDRHSYGRSSNHNEDARSEYSDASSYRSDRSRRSDRSVSDRSDKYPSQENRWRSPSEMTKDEIMSEKMDLIYRYGRLERNGYKSGLSLNMRTPLETLRAEVTKLERMRQVQRSIRTQRKLLVSFTSGTEYVNKRYNPYKFALDGWSGEVLENIGDYDEVFEELHDKYKDSVQMAPELKLLTMVGGSGLMFHLSNTLFKSSTPQLNDILQKNPDIMAQIQKEALNSMATTNASDPIFGMMMQGVNEKQRQQAQQPAWNGRPGYAPPRTAAFTMPNPQPSNMSTNIGANVNQVPQGQGILNQNVMSGPEGFDDILSQLNQGNMEQTGLISDVDEDFNESTNTKQVSTKQLKKRTKKSKKNENVIDLDM